MLGLGLPRFRGTLPLFLDSDRLPTGEEFQALGKFTTNLQLLILIRFSTCLTWSHIIYCILLINLVLYLINLNRKRLYLFRLICTLIWHKNQSCISMKTVTAIYIANNKNFCKLTYVTIKSSCSLLYLC